MKCIICGIEYEVHGVDSLKPCPNGHTLQEEIAYANSKMKKVKLIIMGKNG